MLAEYDPINSGEPMNDTPNTTRAALDGRTTITVAEAAPLLGLHPETLYDAIARGDMPAIRVGRRLAIPAAHIRRLLQID